MHTFLKPLNDLLSSTSKSLEWTPTVNESFHFIKDTLANVSLLFNPKADAPLNIMTDASDSAVGAVFQQFVDNTWQPISYFSRKFKPTETLLQIINHLLILFSLIPTGTPLSSQTP